MMGESCAVGVLGATGYTGMETVRLLGQHPRLHLLAASARQEAGKPLSVAVPSLSTAAVVLNETSPSWTPDGRALTNRRASCSAAADCERPLRF